MPTYKLVVEYDGSRYAGWQVQPSVPTVQGELLRILRWIFDDPGLRLAGAARTDAGTHALGQVASFTAAGARDPARLRRALNGLLPGDIAVREATEAPEGFHARRSATGRVYRYQIARGEILSPFVAPYAFHFRAALEIARMREAAGLLLGEHDFSSFRAAGDVSSTPVKTIRAIEVEERGELISLSVEGSSFLQHMVRTIAGTLLEVGRGRWRPERVETILRARSREEAGPTLPAKGLFLVKVLYRPGALPTGENG